jgi:hypothetical protein
VPTRFRIAALLLVAVAAAVVALVPGPLSKPIRKLVKVDSEGPDPRFSAPIDAAAVRRAGRIVPDDATYFVWARRTDPLFQGNLKAATQLFLTPALPVQAPQEARWLLSYRARPPVPPGVRIVERVRLGPEILLARVEPAP